jgi:hypothetical protein
MAKQETGPYTLPLGITPEDVVQARDPWERKAGFPFKPTRDCTGCALLGLLGDGRTPVRGATPETPTCEWSRYHLVSDGTPAQGRCRVKGPSPRIDWLRQKFEIF